MKYIIDIDGTLLNSTNPQQGAVEFMANLNKANIDYLLMTNSIKNPTEQVERLKTAGITVSVENILTPIVAINKYLKDKKINCVKIIGTEAEIKQINAKSVHENYELVILLDFEKGNTSYNDLQKLLEDIHNGIEVITASASLYYLKNGVKTIDTGSFVKILEEISLVTIQNFGKPSKMYFDIAANILNTEPDNICAVGDDWSTDIKGANDFGTKSILIKSGKYKNGDEINCNLYQVLNSLSEIQLEVK